jgi:hypothetical protein
MDVRKYFEERGSVVLLENGGDVVIADITDPMDEMEARNEFRLKKEWAGAVASDEEWQEAATTLGATGSKRGEYRIPVHHEESSDGYRGKGVTWRKMTSCDVVDAVPSVKKIVLDYYENLGKERITEARQKWEPRYASMT